MITPYLTIEDIIGIDDCLPLPDKYTKKKVMPAAHQGMYTSYNEQNDLVVHYAIFSPHVDNQLEENKFLEFKNSLLYYHGKNRAIPKETTIKFSDMMTDVNPDVREGYKINVEHPALVADITFLSQGRTSIDYRVSKAVMREQITPSQARLRAQNDSRWFLSDLQKIMQQRSLFKKKMGFQEITTELSMLLHKDAFDYMLMKDMGGVYKTLRQDNTNRQRVKDPVLFGNTLNFTNDFAKYGEKLNRAVVPMTASRHAVQAINQLALAKAIITENNNSSNNENKFSNDFLQTVALYKTLTVSEMQLN
jgi:hypothetical protein